MAGTIAGKHTNVGPVQGQAYQSAAYQQRASEAAEAAPTRQMQARWTHEKALQRERMAHEKQLTAMRIRADLERQRVQRLHALSRDNVARRAGDWMFGSGEGDIRVPRDFKRYPNLHTPDGPGMMAP